MDEYISREEAIKELREVYENEYPTASGDFDEYASHDVPNVLRNMKAADVQPVKHGRWIAENRDNRGYADCYTCTNCNCYSYTYTLMKDCEYEYCPNCGARMDGEE